MGAIVPDKMQKCIDMHPAREQQSFHMHFIMLSAWEGTNERGRTRGPKDGPAHTRRPKAARHPEKRRTAGTKAKKASNRPRRAAHVTGVGHTTAHKRRGQREKSPSR